MLEYGERCGRCGKVCWDVEEVRIEVWGNVLRCEGRCGRGVLGGVE